MTDAISYPLEVAAAKVGYSETTLREAERRGELDFHYRNSKPVVLHTDLVEWISAAPTERKKSA